MPLAKSEPFEAHYCHIPPARVGHLGHELGGRLGLALTVGHSPFRSARSTVPPVSLHSSFFGSLDQTVLIKRQKASSDRVCEKHDRTPPAVYLGIGRPQECSSGLVPHVISVRRLPDTTGVLDQNLDQAIPGNESTAPPLRGKQASEDHAQTAERPVPRLGPQSRPRGEPKAHYVAR
jgi:hypothetical protein